MKNAILLTAILLAFSLSAAGQDTKPAEPTETPQPNANQPDGRANILREIGLSQDQARQIRRLNMDRKPMMEAAQKRLREATRSLDEAIYSDNVDENEIQSRVKEAQLAQADLIRLRSTNELAIRRILTPEQLTRFRDIRQRFEMNRQSQQTDRKLVRPMQNNGQVPTNGFRDTVKRPRQLVKQQERQLRKQ
jgi:Spy/CpxP family protein refolding chaperone